VAAGGIDELREEGQEEERRFGIEEIDQDALAENVAEIRLADGGFEYAGIAATQNADAQENQIGRADVFYELEGQCRGRQQSGKAECSGGYVKERAGGDTHGGDQACGTAVTDAAANDVQNGGTRDN
jgi:hypothetical protein